MKKNAVIFAAFFLPVLIMILAFAREDIYPFGDNQIAIIDMYHQYVPFLSELQYKLKTGGSLFYSWNGGSGYNFWNLLAYYGASPLNLILAFFPLKKTMDGVTLILLIKIGLSGSFMCINLLDTGAGETQEYSNDLKVSGIYSQDGMVRLITEAVQGRTVWRLGALPFSCMYALSAYVMGYFWCIMWMDAVMLLPLCVLGLRRLIAGRGFALYSCVLALIIFCNYYISIMVCIFILVYYPVLYFTRQTAALGNEPDFGTYSGQMQHPADLLNASENNISAGRAKGARSVFRRKCGLFFKTTGKAVGASFLALGLSAVMLLPTYISMQSTYYISSKMPDEWRFYNDPLDVLNQLLPNAQLTYREGLPNLYCGMLTVILFIVFLLAKRIRMRDKLINLGFLVFMFFSLNVNKLDFIWHGFHFPNQLPYRFSFVICFVLICIAYKAFFHINELKPKSFFVILSAGVFYYLFAEKILVDKLDSANIFIYSGLALLTAFAAILILKTMDIIGMRGFVALLLTLVSIEMCFSTCISFDKVGSTTRSAFMENYDNIQKLNKYLNKQEFARTETDSQLTLNEPARLHFKGVSMFSSSLNAGTTQLMESIGLEGKPEKNRYNYNLTDPVTNSMLNIRYLISEYGEIDNEYFKKILSYGDSCLYENEYPLSVGYVLPRSIRTWDNESEDPFENLEDYIRAATGNESEQVFLNAGKPEISLEDAKADTDYEEYAEITPASSDAAAEANLNFTADTTGDYYVYAETDNAESITVQREDVLQNVDIEKDCASIVNIGSLKKGEAFTIKIQYAAGLAGGLTYHVRTLDKEAWKHAYNLISQNTMTVTDYSDTQLSGTVDSDESGVLLLSVPYDRGWTLKIDGTVRSTDDLAGGAWICSTVDAGRHQISLSFRPPGIRAGALITILCALAIAVISIISRAKVKKASRLRV